MDEASNLGKEDTPVVTALTLSSRDHSSSEHATVCACVVSHECTPELNFRDAFFFFCKQQLFNFEKSAADFDSKMKTRAN